MTEKTTYILQDALKAHTRSFHRLVNAIDKNPTKEDIHQLRIHIRKLRAILWLTKHSKMPLKFKSLSTQLRNLGHVLGTVRELDVAAKDSKIFHLKSNHIAQKQKRVRKRLHNDFGEKQRKILFAQLNKAIRRISKIKYADLTPALRHLESKIKAEKSKRLKTDRDYHKLRITVKKTRYILEALHRPTTPLRRLQKTLGKAHDLKVLGNLSGQSPKLEHAKSKIYRKAEKIIKPTLKFASKQLALT